MKKSFLVCLALCLLFSFKVSASEVAILDVGSVVNNSVAAINLKKELETEADSFRKKMSEKELSLKNKQDTLMAKSNTSVANTEGYQKEVRDFQNEFLAFREEAQNLDAKLQKKMMDGMTLLQKEIKKIVSEMIKEPQYSKYKNVMISESFIYYNKDNDISAEVLKRLNKKVKNISVLQNQK